MEHSNNVFETKKVNHDPITVIFGPSSLYYIAKGDFQVEVPQNIKFALPDNLLHLIEISLGGSEKHRNFLKKIVVESHEEEEKEERLSADVIVRNLYEYFFKVIPNGRLYKINEGDIEGYIRELVSTSFENQGYEIELSPIGNWMREFYLRALSWSKKTGAVIVETTKRYYDELKNYIASLEIPERFDAIIDKKQEFIGSLFKNKGGKAAKWFLKIIITIAMKYTGLDESMGYALAQAITDP